jgi:TonB family protein
MFTTWIVDWTLRATLILTVAWGAAAVHGRQAAALRHLVWTLALLGLLLLPAASNLLPGWNGGTKPVRATVSVVRSVNARAEAISHSYPRFESVPWVLLMWGVGCALVMLRWTRGALRTHALARRTGSAAYALGTLNALRAQAGVVREVRVLESPDTAVALVWGLRRPAVILPVEASGWEPERLRAVLAHELAHVKRWDLATQLLAQFTCAVYWFHPLVWLAFRRSREERERACDDAALSHGIAGTEYAGYLIDLVRTLAAYPPADAPAMGEARDLELRVRAILDPAQSHRAAGRRPALAIALAAAALVLAVGSFRATAQSTSALFGTVADPNGARIVNAQVIARNLETGAEFTSVAGPAGNYAFATLPAGNYTLSVSVPGFETYQAPVTVGATGTGRLDVMLHVGGIKDSITISAHGNPTAQVTKPSQAVRIKVGGNVQAPKPLVTPSPVYPESLQQQGVHGSIVLRGIINTTGQVFHPEVVNLTEVNPELAALALQTFRSWTYSPALLDGEPVSSVITITMNFQLVP